MYQRLTSLLLAVAVLMATFLPASAATSDALGWLGTQVQSDGGFSDGFSEGSNLSATTEALFAAVAAKQDPTAWGSGTTPLDYLAAKAPTATKTGDIARMILLATATGQNPAAFGGTDLLAALEGLYDARTGLFTGTVPEHAYAMIAHKAVGKAIPEAATAALVGLQGEDGGWAFSGTGPSDTNTTGLVLQALAAAGQGANAAPVQKALTFLEGQQNEDGGFPYQTPSDYGTESDANSTAWVIQGLLAQGQSLADWKQPERFLASLQQADGSFLWKKEVPGANFLATAQAVPALEGVTLLTLPTVTVAKAPSAPAPAATPDAPTTLPTTGSRSTRWADLLAAGALLLLTGAGVRRWALR